MPTEWIVCQSHILDLDILQGFPGFQTIFFFVVFGATD